jgi:perosamine synthetase
LDPIDEQRARSIRWFGIDRTNSKPTILGEREYDIAQLGYKYHLNDLGAAVGIGNLGDLPRILNRRTEIAGTYASELQSVPGLTMLHYEGDRKSAWWLFTLLVEQREDFIRKLASHAVPASVVHLRIDHNSVFGGLRRDLPNQEKFNANQIAIPVHSGLSDEDIVQIVKVIQSGW